MNLFKEVIPSILETKEYMISSEDEEKSFDNFMTNRALSHHIDCIFYVNEMNKNYHLDKKLQYDYLFYSIKKSKRPYKKWIKSESVADLSIVKEYFGYSNEKAKEALRILSPDQIAEIKKRLDKGGQQGQISKNPK